MSKYKGTETDTYANKNMHSIHIYLPIPIKRLANDITNNTLGNTKARYGTLYSCVCIERKKNQTKTTTQEVMTIQSPRPQTSGPEGPLPSHYLLFTPGLISGPYTI